MKKLTILLGVILSCLLVLVNKASAQIQKDTIYYLLDIASTPVNDRIITVETEGSYRLVSVNCHCMENYEIPVFKYNIKLNAPLSRKIFKSVKLLTLVRLMELARAVTSVDFQIRHDLYFIEPKGKDYMLYPATALSRQKITGDAQPIKTGG